MELEPYLFFYGKCEDALGFYKDVFGGEIESINRFGDTPMGDQMPPAWKNKVMHASFKSPDLKFMAADGAPDSHATDGNIALSLGSKDAKQAQRVFDRLAEGGKVEQPFSDSPWGAKFGMLIDKYGIEWMINCDQS